MTVIHGNAYETVYALNKGAVTYCICADNIRIRNRQIPNFQRFQATLIQCAA